MSFLTRMAMSVKNPSLYDAIAGLGLTANLKICLDAGDAASYPGTGTKWLDTSGNGYDFNFGDGVTSTTYPTFNGTAGKLSSAEYFSFDGGDYFSYDSANEAWMNTLNNDGAVWSYLAIFYAVTLSSSNNLIATSGSSNYGIRAGSVWTDPPGVVELSLSVSSPAATWFFTPDSGNSINNNAWNVLGLGVSENGGVGASAFISKNGTATYDGSYSTGASAEVPGAFTIGARASHDSALTSGTRLACLAVWQGTALTATNLSDIYDEIRGRFGL